VLNIDEAIIIVSVISGIFGIMGLLILDRNWFRREQFKFDIDTKKKTADLQFKKMRKDLGLDTTKGPSYRASSLNPLDTAGGLINLLKGLDADKIAALSGILGGTAAAEPEEAPEGIESLIQFALDPKNRDLVEGFLKGIKKPEAGTNEGQELL